MNDKNLLNKDYKLWISEVKSKIRSTQLKAAVALNIELIKFYWFLGEMLNEQKTEWGSGFLDTVSIDLKKEFPDIKGFSVTNLKYCRMYYQFFSIRPQAGDELKYGKSPQLGDEFLPKAKELSFRVPWGHTKEIISKTKNVEQAYFYLQKTIENNWSRDVLSLQLKSGLFNRSGKSINNFKNTLPKPLSDLAEQTLKDPYVFDFMTMTKPYQEKDIEEQLVTHIRKFLLELGKGFAFVGQQFQITIAENDYYIDLLFYHIRLKCYVVIELKNTKFIPEYAGKLNFYLSAVDSILKGKDDKPTIGMVLCRDKNNVEAEFALRGINKPMGVTEFQLTDELPENLKSSLPTIEELERNLTEK
jgi:predicted nuclease of restriction endonuclease-like (RecB) superfamily